MQGSRNNSMERFSSKKQSNFDDNNGRSKPKKTKNLRNLRSNRHNEE